MTVLAYVPNPCKNVLYGVDRLTKRLSGAPAGSENLVLRRYYCPREALEESPDVQPFSVSNVSHVPQDTEAFRIGNPKQLFLSQPIDFKELMRIPEAFIFTNVPKHPEREILPLRHDQSISSFSGHTNYLAG